jgi:hypothetical protein
MDGARGVTIADTGTETIDAFCERFRWGLPAVPGRDEVAEWVDAAPLLEAECEIRAGIASFSDASEESFILFR